MTPTDEVFFDLQRALSGRFSIEREIGRGGMGIVYLARDVQLERDVAIKLLAPTLAAGAGMRRNFVREARVAAQCFHPNIVPIHSVHEEGPLAWFVMAYVRGETLAERVRRAGVLGANDLNKLAQEIGWALSYAHDRGLVHRDVKPENILIDAASERFLIADFGIARGQHGDEMVLSGANAAGTPRYMAPEQAAGGAVDGRADLYALGATLFFAATGRPPFEGTSAAALMVQHNSVLAPSMREHAHQVPEALADAVDRCLAKFPDSRFPSAQAFVDFITPAATAQMLPPSLLPVQSSASGARALLGWAAAVGVATMLLAAGEKGDSFARDIIGAVGYSASASLVALGVFRAGEALAQARRALRLGTAVQDVTHALEGESMASNGLMHTRSQSAVVLMVGVTIALLQGRLPTSEVVPGFLNDALQIGFLFAPAYLIARGVTGLVSGSALRRFLHRRVEQPMARLATRAARLFLPLGARRPVTPVSDAPTELRLGRAVHEVLARLPEARHEWAANAGTAADALVRDANALRRLDLKLAAAERVTRQSKAADRDLQLAQLTQERADAKARIATTVAALESLRLDLLRVDAATPGNSSLTSHLEAVRDLARRVDAEAELRAYLAQSNPTPA